MLQSLCSSPDTPHIPSSYRVRIPPLQPLSTLFSIFFPGTHFNDPLSLFCSDFFKSKFRPLLNYIRNNDFAPHFSMISFSLTIILQSLPPLEYLFHNPHRVAVRTFYRTLPRSGYSPSRVSFIPYWPEYVERNRFPP